MPKDDLDEKKKKKSPEEVDDEDLDFDEQMEHAGEDDEDEKGPPKAARGIRKDEEIDPLDEEDFDEVDLKAANTPVFGGQNETQSEEDLTPKPTFKYNAPPPPPPPSDDPIMEPKVMEVEEEHTLDDLSEEDLQSPPPQRQFRVDRGEMPQEDDENQFPRPLHKTAFQPDPDAVDYRHQNLEIPSIRKHNNGPYPPHQGANEEYENIQRPRMGGYQAGDNYQEPDYGNQPPSNRPFSNRPYAPNDYGNGRGGYSQRQPKGASKWHIIILLLIGGAVIGATVYLLQNQFGFPGKPAATPEPTPNQVVESTPAPTPTPIPLERSQFKVRVLNGTTKPGIAKTTLDKLKGQGYQTDRSGNAPKQDYTQTMVRVKEGESSLSAQLTKDLAPDYAVASVAADLKKTDTVDAEIILGDK